MEKHIKEFIEKANNIYNNKYDYSKCYFSNQKETITIICPMHGEFSIKRANNHIAPSKLQECPKCTKYASDITKKDNEYFIEKAKSIHKDKYDYSLVDYKGTHDKVKIICSEHGVFEQTPSNHYKYGCKSCGRIIAANKSKGKTSHFTSEGFTTIAKGRDCYFYILECWNDEEQFYKFGITSLSVKERYNKKSAMPYNYKIIQEEKGTPDEVWKKEQEYKKKLDIIYKPKIKFNGSETECFNSY